MIKIVIYTRFSPRPNADKCDSCEKQQERCESYCRARGYDVMEYDIYEDKDVSGGTLSRPQLLAAIDALGEGDILVVDSIDRLSRDMLVALTIRHEIDRKGAKIEYANGTPNKSTPEGKLFSHILSAFAAYERDRVRFATSRGMKRRQANGEWFGKPPIGWMLDPKNSKKLIQNELEIRAIRKIIEWAKGPNVMTYSCIAELITREFGLCRGKPWSARTVRRIIKNHSEDEQ